MKILVDADIILEALLNRPNFIEDAKKLWEVIQKLPQQIQAYTTKTGLDIICVHLSTIADEKSVENLVAEIQRNITICHVESETWQEARTLNIQDFQSAIEVVCARELNIGAIVTQKPQDYEGANLSVLSVNDFLDRKKFEEIFNNPTTPLIKSNSISEFIEHLNRLYFQKLEDKCTLNYRIRHSIDAVLKAFEVIKKRSCNGISFKELVEETCYTEITLKSLFLDLQKFNLAFKQRERVIPNPNITDYDYQKLAGYLAESLKEHIVTQEIFKQLKPGERRYHWYLKEIIAQVYPTEDPKYLAQNSKDYSSRMLSWFFFTGLLEYTRDGRGNKVIARPIIEGEGRQKGKLTEDTEAKQLELFAEIY